MSYGPQVAISTVHIVGFPANTHEREMENLCRWFPGFVGVKATFANDMPKVWIRFDSPENALNAAMVLNEQPLDMVDTHMKMRASIAKTELNVTTGSLRKGPVTTSVGPLDSLMAKADQANAQLQFGGVYGASQGVGQQMYPGVIPCWDGQPLTGGLDAYGATTKRRRVHEDTTVQDTLVLMGCGEKGLDEQKCTDLFGRYDNVCRLPTYAPGLATSAPGPRLRRLDGFVTSTFSRKGVDSYFAKYTTTEYANAAKAKCEEQGLYPQVLILCVVVAVVAVVARRARVVVVSTQQQPL